MRDRLLILAALAASSIFGQNDNISIPRPVPDHPWEQLKQYLVLSEAQVASLNQIRQNRLQQEQGIYQQISDKQRQMYALLQQGSNDAGTIGRLMVEINNLQRQLPLKGDTHRAEVLAVLTPQQKAKLPALSEALALQSTGWQAIELNMIDNPNIPDIRILPMPANTLPGIEPASSAYATRSAR